jgi:hypothetical protein
MEDRPENLSGELQDYWGGYRIEFKLADAKKYERLGGSSGQLDAVRRDATIVGLRNSRTFQIDISRFEYTIGREAFSLDGYTVYVYTPLMILCEKIRAICQQMPEYVVKVHKHATARARDFFDIYNIVQKFPVDWSAAENRTTLKAVFDAKRVPLDLISKIKEFREFHRPDFQAVIQTVKPETKIRDFDFYFDFVITISDTLQALGIV